MSRLEGRRGSSLVELAIALSMLSFIVIGAIDFGRIGYTAMALTNAARTGALVGSRDLASSGNTTAMQNAAIASAASDIGTISAVASRSCECLTGGTTTAISCSPMGACAGSVRIRVSVTTSKTFNMIVRVPGLRSSVLLTRRSIMRAQ